MLIDEIKKANMQAMKDRDSVKRAILSIVINKYTTANIEAKATGKELTDADMLSIIQKTLKELKDEADGYWKTGNAEKYDETGYQYRILNAYLPKQLTENEIKAIISSLSDISIPSVMKHFKANYAGQVDMSVVSRIARGV